MAVERRDLFGDGKVYCDYYPHKRVELRVAGFKIVIYKPYTAPVAWDKDRVYKGAKMYMSTNSTVCIEPSDLGNFQRAVQAGIAILNSEGYNLITDKDFLDETKVDKSKVPNLDKIDNKAGKITYVKYDKSDAGSIITMPNGRKSLYLGTGKLFERNSSWWSQSNRAGCYEVYLDYSGDIKLSITQDNMLEVHITSGYAFVDTLKNKRKAISIDGSFKGINTEDIIVRHNAYISHYRVQ